MQYGTGQLADMSNDEPKSVDELGIDLVAYIEQVELLIELTEIETQTVAAQAWEQLAEVADAKRLLQPLIQELSGLWPQLGDRLAWLDDSPASYLTEDDRLERDGLSLLRSVLVDLDEALERNEATLWRAQSANRMTLDTLVRVFSSTADAPDVYTRNGVAPAPPPVVSIVGQTVSI